MSHAKGLFCDHCQREIPEKEFHVRCESCGGPLILRYDLEALHRTLSTRSVQLRAESLLRQWLDILPINHTELIDKVSLGVSSTLRYLAGIFLRMWIPRRRRVEFSRSDWLLAK